MPGAGGVAARGGARDRQIEAAGGAVAGGATHVCGGQDLQTPIFLFVDCGPHDRAYLAASVQRAAQQRSSPALGDHWRLVDQAARFERAVHSVFLRP